MPEKSLVPLEPEHFYHLYNRGINGENIFKSKENYPYFLQKYHLFADKIVDTYAYCLLGNHFHLLVKVKSLSEIEANFPSKNLNKVSNLISQQFSHFFNGYAQAINHRYQRTGSLFQRPFRRKKIDSEQYLIQALHYVHANPEKHGFVKDFRDYPYSSYHDLLKGKLTEKHARIMLEWFDGKKDFVDFHASPQQYQENEWAIEMD